MPLMEPKPANFLIPLLLCALVVATTYSADVRPVLVRAFGEYPFGLPVTHVVAVGQCFVLLPFAYSIYHFVHIANRAAAEGRSLGTFGLLSYAVSVGKRHPELRRSQVISLLGLIYFAAVCTAWIIYADMRGI